MKKISGILLFVMLSIYSHGQIADEIESYVDSIEITVHKGRKMMLHELGDSNMIKVRQIYDYLTELSKDEYYSAFYYLEDFYINLLTNDWQSIDDLMLNYDLYRNKTIYPNSTGLIQTLYELTTKNSQQILINCNESFLSDQAKSLVDILMQYIKQERSDKEFNEKLSSYYKYFKDSRYENFEKGFMPKKIVKASLNLSFGSGMIFTTKDLSDNFSNNASFNMGMDINIGKVFTSLYMQGSGLKLQEPFTATSNIESIDFTMNERFSYFDGGLKAGYFLIRNNWFHLTPYVSISGSYLESTKYDDPEDNDLEYEIFNSFTYGAGLHTEFKFYEYEIANIYGNYTSGYLSLKVEAGYNKINTFKDTYCKGDTPYILCAFVWGFGQF